MVVWAKNQTNLAHRFFILYYLYTNNVYVREKKTRLIYSNLYQMSNSASYVWNSNLSLCVCEKNRTRDEVKWTNRTQRLTSEPCGPGNEKKTNLKKIRFLVKETYVLCALSVNYTREKKIFKVIVWKELSFGGISRCWNSAPCVHEYLIIFILYFVCISIPSYIFDVLSAERVTHLGLRRKFGDDIEAIITSKSIMLT